MWCDLSPGTLHGAARSTLVNADVTTLPVRDGMVDVVLATHRLDLVPDRSTAVRELRRGPSVGGTRVVVTSGPPGLGRTGFWETSGT